MAQPYRCPDCRTRRASFMSLIEHCREQGHVACHCSGYHYPHRPGSPYCEKNSMAPLRAAIRAGGCTDEELLEIELDCALWGAQRPLMQWPD